ncbi:amidohydrolase [Gammaproteobacteria bacterium]|nr:amidohydrolase [Gammaproteobacteria bacterium]
MTLNRRLTATFAWVALIALVSSGQATGSENADTIWFGGPMLTMDDTHPRASAVAVAKGRIIAVGDHASVTPHANDETQWIDLQGRSLLPGFVDAHGHVTMGGLQALVGNLLAPPDGDVTDIASLQAEMRSWIEANAEFVEKTGVILGFGYDPAQLAEQRHPNRHELDAISADHPVYLMHQSGHFGVANSRALIEVGLNAKSADPAGGIIRRIAGSNEPNGVLEENAHLTALTRLLGQLDPEAMTLFARKGAAMWARYGYTTAQEGRASPSVAEMLRSAGVAGHLPIDVVVYPDILIDRDYIAREHSRNYRDRVRIGGAKLTIDGSPQGFTAWRDRPYYAPVGDYPEGYAGYASASIPQVMDAVAWSFANDVQIITHSNGERSTDLFLSAVERAERTSGQADRRPVLIHGQFLRRDQVGWMKRLQVFPSLFPMHTFYWGDWHRDHTVGPLHADNISPTGWVREHDMRFSTHHDAPVALPNSMRVLDATVTRRTRSGDILGPSQRVDVMTALKAMTIWPAWQHFEEADKGSLEVGKIADFVVLDADPTAIDPKQLNTLTIVETIKEGVSIYHAASASLDAPTAVYSLAQDHELMDLLWRAIAFNGASNPTAAAIALDAKRSSPH